MTDLSLLTRLGLFVVDDFVAGHALGDLLAGLAASPRRTAEFYQPETGWRVNEEVRKATWIEASETAATCLRTRLVEVQPRVEQHFDLSLSAFEDPQFLVYEPGDYIRMHIDTQDDPNMDDVLRSRKVSVIMFFNDPGTGPDDTAGYGGGSLVFSVGTSRALSAMRLPVEARAGRLVAFRSHMPHEVEPVTCGTRYSAVTWFR